MTDTDIAIVGLGCRLPGAQNPDEFWQLLRDGRCARTEFADDALRALGVSEQDLRDPAYVKAGMKLDGIDQFDAGFFGFSPRDAAIMDPQHRVFLEVCWEALEHAAHVPDRFDGRIGVFAGCGMDTYLLHNVLTNPQLVRDVGMFLIRHTGNDKDFLATRVSYQFDLRGPSVNVLTACSTSLVAIHQAAQSLLAGECDLALAGGVTILVPQERGYRYEPGEILSPDGHCRAFDASSKGTIFGSGAGVVVLRRLADAQRDGDHVHAVLAGSAVNNDGARKVGYLAPSVDGYAEVVAEALALADVTADQVQYVEAHGTGTPVGDPIEIEALTQAFRATTERTQFCGIGSVKTNIGHLDTAAGIAGLLKVVLAMQHGQLPKSLHFEAPNPLIDFARSPFQVVAREREWAQPADGLRIAGVSSLGVGGTNAHAVLRQAPAPVLEEPAYPRRYHLLPLSARSDAAVLDGAQRLAGFLGHRDDDDLPAIAATLQLGRKGFAHRAFAVGLTAEELATDLASGLQGRIRKAPERPGSVVFLFPGGGAQYPGMGRGLYEHEAAYRAAADECLAALPDDARAHVHALLFGARSTAAHAAELERPSLALPALFCTEYALARTLAAFGVEPEAMLGHSMGEYVAACLAGVFSPAQGMQIVRLRGELFEEVAQGAMLSVPVAADRIDGIDGRELSLAAANAPGLSAVAGSVEAIERLQARLLGEGVECQRLRIHVAAHSHLLDPILDRFREGLRGIPMQPAQRPFVSNVTGDWIEPARAADPDYWVTHLRHTVRFQDGAATLLAAGDRTFVEVGPGKALLSLVRLHEASKRSAMTTSLPHAQETVPADRALLECLGRLFQAGVRPDWRRLQGGPRRRVPLPTYAFQRQRYWIEPGKPIGGDAAAADRAAPTRLPVDRWRQVPAMVARALDAEAQPRAAARWLVVGGGGPLLRVLQDRVQALGGGVFHARTGAGFADADGGCAFAPRDPDSVSHMLAAAGEFDRVLFLMATDGAEPVAVTTAMVRLLQALGQSGRDAAVRLLCVTESALPADGAPQQPEQAVVHGFARVVAREYDGLVARAVDVGVGDLDDPGLVEALLREIEAPADAAASVALRRGRRLVPELQPAAPVPAGAPGALQERGVYLITGGLGGLGLEVASDLATRCRARLVLVSRRGLPPREAWDGWLALRPDDAVGRAIARVRALEAAGSEVLVCAADVGDLAAMTDVVARAQARFGALHGVFHAAGVLDDGPIQLRRAEQVERVLRPKVLGAQVLDAATAALEPGLMVLFASTSGLRGIPGQCDYAAANAFLDSFAHWRTAERPGRTLAVDWGVWRDVGMVASGLGDGLRRAGGAAAPALLGERRERDDGVEFAATWNAATHWPLAEHRLQDGRAVLPGTGHLELCLCAARAASGATSIELCDLELRAPLAFVGDESRRVYVVVRDGGGELQLAVESASADGRARTEHARAVARPGSGAGEFVHLDAWWQRTRRAAPTQGRQRDFVQFGPRWESEVRSGYGDAEVTAELRLPPEFAADLAEHPAHPALVDAAILAVVPLLPGADRDTLYAPVACRSVQWSAGLPEHLVVRAAVVEVEAHSGLCTVDLRVATARGVPVLDLRGLQLLGLQGGFAAAPSAAAPAAQKAARPTAPAAPSPQVRHLLDLGITPAEGVQLLQDALRSGATQVAISSLGIDEVAAWLGRPVAQARPQSFGPAPAAAGTTDAPRDEVEFRIAAAFRELLGIEHVGIDQDFFELGGHSLLAVRLFARVHRDFGVDLELATLLSAGSVRALATVLRQHLGLPAPAESAIEALHVPAHTGEHLVPIRTKGDRPVLFLVHGAGGNVLGFRDLSHYLGKDQPVYGLQARGVDGKQPPHERIEDMARDYLAELQQAQPHGPYYLGGYSGGGCVAFEMARQLRLQGEPVAFVGMIDTPSPHMKERGLLARGAIHARRLWERGPLYPVRMLKDKFAQRRTQQQHRELTARGETLPQELRGAQMQDAFDAAFFRYQVKPYDGRIWLFRAEAESRTKYVRDRTLGWEPYPQGGVVSIDCPGDHFSMCAEPHIRTLCQRYRAAMDDAIAAATPPVPTTR
ncbi:MAG: SDR family NAD(P)-dependent oxidoreductase [Planctomycetota bacterium]